MSTKYKRPPIETGSVVQYFQAEGARPCVGICVDNKGEECVALAIFQPGYAGVDYLDGVRHRSDPNKHAIASSGYGTWDYVPAHALVIDLIEELKGKVEGLEAVLAQSLGHKKKA